tara:strand:- start:481 stop:2088 length:1608 start_codon:yes stop_codon:yes gene_type:complete
MSWLDWAFRPHPVYPLPSREQVEVATSTAAGKKKFQAMMEARGEKLRLENEDPFTNGFEPKHWKDADALIAEHSNVLISGGNRSGKTEYCAKYAVKHLMQNAKSRVVCLHTTHQSSLQTQQPVIYKYLPAQLKGKKIRKEVENISYSQKNGFSDNTFILPNGSQCWFMHYSQDPKAFEGLELDLVWADELIPKSLLDTLKFRLVTRSGKMILSFTPVEGMTGVVKEFISGGEVTEWADSELLPGVNIPAGPKGKMPYKMRCRNEQSACVWFHTSWNLFNPYDQLKQRLQGQHNNEIKIRAYGWTDSTVANAFPRFGDGHIVEHQKVPKEGKIFQCVDPAGSRNWFMLWGRVADDALYIYREWPDASMGEWAIPGEKADGLPGPAQRAGGGGNSIAWYKRLISELEDGESVFLRLIDPRACKAKSLDGREILDELKIGEASMWFDPASGAQIQVGVSLINDLLYYDNHRPVDQDNRPRLFVSDRCKNLIFALREWSGSDGERGATKDPIDVLRYIVQEENLFTPSESLGTSGGGSY